MDKRELSETSAKEAQRLNKIWLDSMKESYKEKERSPYYFASDILHLADRHDELSDCLRSFGFKQKSVMEKLEAFYGS